MVFPFRKRRRRQQRASSVTAHYLTHKAAARAVVVERLVYFNQYYGYAYKREAIRNTRRSWGRCSSLGNLNFSYKLLFLPAALRDYVIVHELCHLRELNHGAQFWALVGECIPDYSELRNTLREIDREARGGVAHLSAAAVRYPELSKARDLPPFCASAKTQ